MPIRIQSPSILALTFVAAIGCGNPTKPSNTPPPVEDPPKIACPADISVTAPGATTVAYGSATTTSGKAPVTIVCTPASATTFAVGRTIVTCTATDALQRTDMCTFTVTVQAPPKLKVTRFATFGDSITWGENGSNLTTSALGRFYPRAQFPFSETYPGVLQQELRSRYQTQTSSITVANGGSPGERITIDGTKALDPATFSRFTSVTSSQIYNVILIMEGSNDVNERDQSLFPGAIAGLRQMVLDAKSRGLRPYLATIPPMNPAAPCCRNLGASLVPTFNDQVRGLAASEGVTLADVYQALSGNVTTYIGPDGLHPTASGYAKIADTFFAAIRQTLELPGMTTSTFVPVFTPLPPWGPASVPPSSAVYFSIEPIHKPR